LTAAADRCRDAVLPVSIVSCGVAGTYQSSAFLPGVTEIQAGDGIFGDVHYRDHYRVDHECALTVVTTIVSRPNDHVIVTDGGFKALGTSSRATPEPVGLPPEQVEGIHFAAEHGRIKLTAPNATIEVGQQLEFIVGYSDETVFLHDVLYGVGGETVQAAWEITGRGKLQ
ncbi:MAG: hypothetical protein ACR2NO_06495, partial [Chloroflexota bacterium]